MNIVSIRIITADIRKLVRFYEQITEIKATWYTEDFVELRTENATLAIGSTKTLSLFGENQSVFHGQCHATIIEFITSDVDAIYARLLTRLKPSLIQEPTTTPWGNRSLLFRDPDGNMVNFFTPVTPEKQLKFYGKSTS